MFQVTFQIENQDSVEIFAAPDSNLLEVARSANVAIDAPCSGNVSCGKCKVKLLEGTLDSPKTMHISQEEYEAGWRLACNSKLTSDVTIFVPDIASAYQSRMKTADLSSGQEIAIFEKLLADIRAAGIDFTPALTELIVSVDEPTLDDTMPDNERISRAIKARLGAERVVQTFPALVKLPQVLRESGFSIRCVGTLESGVFTLLDVFAADDTSPLCALAVDIGTTTVSAVLADLKTGNLLAKASSGNGQIRYGADVINRILEQGKPGGKKKLQDAILKETLVPIIAALCSSAKVSANQIYKMCVASNTTMNHLLVGVDADPVRTEPYIPAFFAWHDLKAGDLKLPLHPDAPVILAPNIGSYVGGDITAGAFTTLLWDKDEFSLFVDLGTNGEIVFGNRDFMMSCACSAGPAFEGGDISCGMRATDGAIEACSIDTATMEPTLHIIGDAGQKPVGLCGSGIIDVISELYRTGIISPKGIFKRDGQRVVHDEHGTGRYILAFAGESETGREIAINEVDIDNFIRAKGAIFSAIDTMLTAIDMDVSMIDHLYVAGGIGSGINMKNAVNIGMFPDVDLDKFEYIGNSSLAGAYAMVLSDSAKEKVFELGENMTYLELSTNPSYMDNFVAACFLPHTNSALFPTSLQEM